MGYNKKGKKEVSVIEKIWLKIVTSVVNPKTGNTQKV